MSMTFKKATKQQARLRAALIGPAGSGKTYSALSLATHLVPGGRIAVIDTEHGSASKYADIFAFDVLELDSFSPETYVEAMRAAEGEGFDVVVVDSLSHAWMGKDGALEQVDAASKRDTRNNSYTAWRQVTPKHNALVEAIIACRCHVIATIRAKTEYVQEKDDRGKTIVRKVGLAPVQRDGLEYEFDVTGDMTLDNEYVVSKSRCPALTGKMFPRPGKDLAGIIRTWLDGSPPAAPAPAPTTDWTTKAATHERALLAAHTRDEVERVIVIARKELGRAPRPILDSFASLVARKRAELTPPPVDEEDGMREEMATLESARA